MNIPIQNDPFDNFASFNQVDPNTPPISYESSTASSYDPQQFMQPTTTGMQLSYNQIQHQPNGMMNDFKKKPDMTKWIIGGAISIATLIAVIVIIVKVTKKKDSSTTSSGSSDNPSSTTPSSENPTFSTVTASKFKNRVDTTNAGQVHFGLNTKDDVQRWGLGTYRIEAGRDNVGGDFALYRYNDQGGFLDEAIVVNRATGAVKCNGADMFNIPASAIVGSRNITDSMDPPFTSFKRLTNIVVGKNSPNVLSVYNSGSIPSGTYLCTVHITMVLKASTNANANLVFYWNNPGSINDEGQVWNSLDDSIPSVSKYDIRFSRLVGTVPRNEISELQLFVRKDGFYSDVIIHQASFTLQKM